MAKRTFTKRVVRGVTRPFRTLKAMDLKRARAEAGRISRVGRFTKPKSIRKELGGEAIGNFVKKRNKKARRLTKRYARNRKVAAGGGALGAIVGAGIGLESGAALERRRQRKSTTSKKRIYSIRRSRRRDNRRRDRLGRFR